MDQANRREVLFAAIGVNFGELGGVLDEKIQDTIDLQAPDGIEKLIESVDMEADIAEVGTCLESYLRTSKEEYKLRVFENIQDVQAEVNQFKSLRLAQGEQDSAAML